MKDREKAIEIAYKVMDRPYYDPDDYQVVLAQNFIREIERHGYCMEDVEDGKAVCGVRMECHLHPNNLPT